MTIDWAAAATIASPVIALFVGVWVNRKFESRPVLISYFGHVSAFRHVPPGGQPLQVNTHAVVLRNSGRRSASNVRIHHAFLPNFQIWPSVAYRVEDLPDGTRDIVIPTLVPGEEITVSYLYFPPLTAAGINAGIKCDLGFAQEIPVLLQRQYPRWLTGLLGALAMIGLITVLYLATYGVVRLLR